MKHFSIIIIISFLSGIGGAYFYHKIGQNSSTVYGAQETTQYRTVNYTSQLLEGEVNFVNASSVSTPSVVYIKTAASKHSSSNWYDYFFYGVPQNQVVISSGSGVIYSRDGYIITNNHVIENAEQIEVIHNKRSYTAKLIGNDPSTDLAVLKVESTSLPEIKLGISRLLHVGDWVLAVGNPFNLESTVTAGIVSAKGRNINILKGRFPIESFIQTDAAINPGNSGGALVNLRGELIGINTAILSQTGSYAGYGFAVPIDIVKKVVEDIIKYGEVQNAYLGADVSEVNSEVAKKLNLSDLSGVVVTSILREGPAEKVGLKPGDVILELNGDLIDTKSAFDEEVSYHRPGDKIKVKFKREGKIIEGSLTLTNKEGTTELIKKEVHISDFLGAELETVPKIERLRLGIESGVRIAKVLSNGLIARMGLSEGFIVTAINNKKIVDLQDLPSTLQKLRGRVILEGISSDGRKGYYSFIF